MLPQLAFCSDPLSCTYKLNSRIEEREKLEERTRLQFIKHEKILKSLGEKLNSIDPSGNSEFLTVNEFCKKYGIENKHYQLIFGWCIKIVSEESEPSQDSLEDGEIVKSFPVHVLFKAVKKVMPQFNTGIKGDGGIRK